MKLGSSEGVGEMIHAKAPRSAIASAVGEGSAEEAQQTARPGAETGALRSEIAAQTSVAGS